jgi:hypothetical protein
VKTIAYKRRERTDVTRQLPVEPTAAHSMPIPWERADGSSRVLLHTGEPDEHPWRDWRDDLLDTTVALCDRFTNRIGALAARIHRREP